jgi:hypothetical protein
VKIRFAAVWRSRLCVTGRFAGVIAAKYEYKTSVRVKLETVSSDAAKPVWFLLREFHGAGEAFCVGENVNCDLKQ